MVKLIPGKSRFDNLGNAAHVPRRVMNYLLRDGVNAGTWMKAEDARGLTMRIVEGAARNPIMEVMLREERRISFLWGRSAFFFLMVNPGSVKPYCFHLVCPNLYSNFLQTERNPRITTPGNGFS